MAKVDYIERLEKLGEVVRAVPPKLFDMGLFTGDKTSCGTVGCAAGHAGRDPWFIKRGLTISPSGLPTYRGEHNAFASLEKFFGITVDEAEVLFCATDYDPEGWRAKRKFLSNLRKLIREKRS